MTKNNQLTDHYFRSLNRNIILIIIIVSVIPLVLVSSTIYYQFRVAYHEKVYDHLRELVNSHSQNIDHFLQEKLSDVFLGLRGLPHFIIAVGNNREDGHWILRATIDFVRFTTLVENIRLGQTDTTVQDIHIKELLEELVALSTQRAKYSMVEIQTDFPDNLPCLKESVSELQQVFFNLNNNALDAMENDGGTLTISSQRKENYIIIEVSDTGKGIPKANLDRLFDPFFTTKPVGKGTGLGLSICYGIIDKMGGKLKVESTVGTGTTFLVSIPFKENGDG